MTDFNEVILDMINQVEGDGIDLKEEEIAIDIVIEERPDVLISICFVDKAISDTMDEAADLYKRMGVH